MKAYVIDLLLKDTEKVSWKKGLSSYLKKTYGSHQWSRFYDEKLASKLDHLRDNANGELSPESHLDQNLMYYAYLEQLYLRLGNKSPQFKMDFTWYEAEYSTVAEISEDGGSSVKYTQSNLAFEKACTLYNIAAILVKASKEHINDADSKDSIKYMTQAMSCFHYISENFLNPPSRDLQTENTKFLKDLAHAQAQEMFVFKLVNNNDINENKQASLISKLASSTANLYTRCHDFLGNPGEEKSKTYGDPIWRNIITGKWRLFRSITAFNHAMFLEQTSKYGQAIAYLELASKEIHESIHFRHHLNEFIDFDSFESLIVKKKQQLNKDNDYIYHDIIPSSTVSLDTIKPMDAIKLENWLETMLKSFMDKIQGKADILFKGIIPMDIFEKDSIYSETKNLTLLRKELDNSQVADLEYTSFMDFTSLHTLLPKLESMYKNSNSNSQFENPKWEILKNKVSLILDTFNNKNFKDIPNQINMVINKRKEIQELLPLIPKDQMANIVKLKSSLLEASNSDEKLFALINTQNDNLRLLMDNDKVWLNFNKLLPAENLSPSLIDMDDDKQNQILNDLSNVKQMAEDLKLLKDERERIILELKDEVAKDDITRTLIVNLEKNESELNELFENELEKFTPLTTRIETTIFKQNSNINDIKLKLDQIFKVSGFNDHSKEDDQKIKECENFVTNLEISMKNFEIFQIDLPKGLNFYESLLKITKDLLNVTSSANNSTSPSNPNSALSSPLLPAKPSLVPPALPPQPSNLSSSFSNMTITSPPLQQSTFNSPNVTMTPQHYPINTQYQTQPQIPVPQPQSQTQTQLPPAYTPMAPMPGAFAQPTIAPQTQMPIAPSAIPTPMPYSNIPPKPPKNADPMVFKKENEREMKNLQRNPTDFYNKPSVFDEDLYSKFSK
ncbi:hypothetical protein TBLA_0H03720 [Henningerozyma blattae CBS 6284]|uniref:BRO domain-containing protein 1 n=1 Tax=Henningerozyma blattae (strain ATCC 34711 / CBS 6284 / DSM 70876 / NBRC 10599 / NRRL Y-10934 / UCD 77-7) TaxID=1071380 RepID=I2H8F2_HENB6|nr:hypothetical protein TBLA_0H03720 [Tetrapisispora blattae CBS 6284]CCH62654.1 hypothetical protein TBLA_0H03720 [Tetrapisispora blattae CBS 6284]